MTQRHPRLPASVGRKLPADEVPIDVLIQVQPAGPNQAHHGQCGSRFADGGGLKERGRGDRYRLPRLLQPILLAPFDRRVVQHGDTDTDARHVPVRHAFLERRSLCGNTGDRGTLQPLLDPPDASGDIAERLDVPHQCPSSPLAFPRPRQRWRRTAGPANRLSRKGQARRRAAHVAPSCAPAAPSSGDGGS